MKGKQVNFDKELQDIKDEIKLKEKALKAKERELTNAKYQESLVQEDIRKEKQQTDLYVKEKEDEHKREIEASKKHND